MTNTELNTILTRLFFDYEENHFENTGVWPRRVNLVFGFADYAAALKDWEIADLLGEDNDTPENIARFRQAADKGVSAWLEENRKTLLI